MKGAGVTVTGPLAAVHGDVGPHLAVMSATAGWRERMASWTDRASRLRRGPEGRQRTSARALTALMCSNRTTEGARCTPHPSPRCRRRGLEEPWADLHRIYEVVPSRWTSSSNGCPARGVHGPPKIFRALHGLAVGLDDDVAGAQSRPRRPGCPRAPDGRSTPGRSHAELARHLRRDRLHGHTRGALAVRAPLAGAPTRAAPACSRRATARSRSPAYPRAGQRP